MGDLAQRGIGGQPGDEGMDFFEGLSGAGAFGAGDFCREARHIFLHVQSAVALAAWHALGQKASEVWHGESQGSALPPRGNRGKTPNPAPIARSRAVNSKRPEFELKNRLAEPDSLRTLWTRILACMINRLYATKRG